MLECLPSMCEVLSSACSTEERKVRKKKEEWEGRIDGEEQEERETETESRRREGSQEMNTVLLGEECGMDDVPWRLDTVKESFMAGNKPL